MDCYFGSCLDNRCETALSNKKLVVANNLAIIIKAKCSSLCSSSVPHCAFLRQLMVSYCQSSALFLTLAARQIAINLQSFNQF